MAKSTNAPFLSRVAGADLTGLVKRVIKLDSSGNAVQSGVGASSIPFGVLQQEDVTGMGVSIRAINAPGTGVVIAGAALSTYMTELASDVNGRAVAAASGDWVFGLLASVSTALGDEIEYISVFYKKA